MEPVVRFSTFAGPRKPLNKISKKREARLDARDDCVAAVKERDRVCQGPAVNPELRCYGQLDCHELLSRGRGGSETDPDNCILLCRSCHTWAHCHPAEAVELGLLIPSWANALRQHDWTV